MLQAPSRQCLLYLKQSLSCFTSKRSRSYAALCQPIEHRHSKSVSDHAPQSPWTKVLKIVTKDDRPRARNGDPSTRSEQSRRHWNPESIAQLDNVTITKVIADCKDRGSWQELLNIFRNYYGSHAAPNSIIDPKTFADYVHALYKLKAHRALNGIIRDCLKDPSKALYSRVKTANMLLQHLVRAGKVSQSVDLLLMLRRSGYRLDTISYNTVLHGGRLGAGSKDHLQNMIRFMKADRIPLNCETYNILVAAYAQLREPDSVRVYFRESIIRNLAKTSTYNTVIAYELSLNNWQVSWSLLLEMEAKGLARDDFTYSPFLLYLAKTDRAKLIPDLLARMAQDEVATGSASFNIILHNMLSANRFVETQHLLDHIASGPAKVSEKTFDTILNFYESCTTQFLANPLHQHLMNFIDGELLKDPNISMYDSVQILKISSTDWKQNTEEGARGLYIKRKSHAFPDLVRATQQVQKLVKQGFWMEAIMQYKAIAERGVTPPMQMLVSILAGLVRLRLFADARKFYEELRKTEMFERNIQFQTVTLNIIRPETTLIDIQQLLNFLRSIDVKFDIIFYTAIAWRLYIDERYKDAIALFRNVIGLGIVLDLVAWVVLIECIAKTQNILHFIWCLRTMKDNKVLLDHQARRRIKRVIVTMQDSALEEEVSEAKNLWRDIRHENEVRSIEGKGESFQPTEIAKSSGEAHIPERCNQV